MKNTQKGFIVPLVIALIALAAIGGGIYFYNAKSQSSNTLQSTQSQGTTMNSTTNNTASAKDTYFAMRADLDSATTYVGYLQAQAKYEPSDLLAKALAQIKAYENSSPAYKMTPEQEQQFINNDRSAIPPTSSVVVTNEQVLNGVTVLYLTSNSKLYTSSAGKISMENEGGKWVVVKPEGWLLNAPQAMISDFITNPNKP